MSDVSEAVKWIHWAADQPELSDAWGGVKRPDARLLYDKTVSPKGLKHGGLKAWRYDLGRAWDHLIKGVGLRKLSSLDKMFGSRRQSLSMAWYYIRHSNELNRPDGRVGGTTLYGVWVEEAWHAALWSPAVARAVAKLLLEHPESKNSAEVARLIIAQRKLIVETEKNG